MREGKRVTKVETSVAWGAIASISGVEDFFREGVGHFPQVVPCQGWGGGESGYVVGVDTF